MGVKAELEGWGGRIYEARTAGMRRKRGKQMTQAMLGEAIGTSAQQIGFYESETNWPGWSKWMAMGQALDVTVGWLIAGEYPMEREVEHAPMRVKAKTVSKRPSEKGSDGPRQRRAP